MYTDNKDFYPTKPETVDFMINMIPKDKLKNIKYILEPSAGKGNILDELPRAITESLYSDARLDLEYTLRQEDYDKTKNRIKMDCVEIDETLQTILRQKNYNLIGSDFLELTPYRFYDLIIANFPFSNGAEHFLRSIVLQERMGGCIVGILNSETIRKANLTNKRRILLDKLHQYNARIEFRENEFIDAERKTNVEVAIIYVDIPMKDNKCSFEKEFKKDNANIDVEGFNSLIPNMNKFQKLIFEYNMIINSTIKLFEEQQKINNMLNGFGTENNICICKANGDYIPTGTRPMCINDFINQTNLTYWNKFVTETDLSSKLPSKMRAEFIDFINKKENVSFTMDNLRYFYEELCDNIPKRYEEMVAETFDTFTQKYNYSDREWNKNIHLYNGWKTNDCKKINGKVILPCYHDEWFYRLPDALLDLNIIFNNISGTKYNIDTKEVIDYIKNNEKNVDIGHFLISSFKKGTLHITFKNPEHVKLFNILAGKGKMWIPDSVNKKQYSNMNEEEKRIVREFYTEEEYNNCLQLNANPLNNILMITDK